ncbi:MULTISPECIES: aspartate/glutamate racemase family protein [Rhizobium]|uniref:Aspartate/glutamate racemase family protein n=1 Tax=Rhizobium rhododendri TaxID=2506430 RepID=A0ABY8ILS6_9HYPH|nr:MULTISPECIES: aspartate/glutamate racemase family protein [Rhizobium]MBZ5758450.1 aspartate/glutamate racemase family protein [Rhizobium sp. VS19-DR96]MBZ5764720.1 aspartate/glutamate racemase family protein [Rhizobium sp. VS19-DR129.2]MBZ5772263.1 aspartate/glutamate racemase family protein [Rhizobium sp. VS19-DRK62.2]MBZ5783050.1 aspartate/glutamate racemase family protein [Rhizobium sp. VS19-DR121]MBZ5800498.1 aspartate/glutamate racemase family protein [Rhizobium sp. VS19-DR181]
MRTIGLIGGMSFESSAVYYRLVNEMVRDAHGGLTSAEVLMHSVNFADIVALQKAGRWTDAARRLGDVAAGLERAGADCVLICTNTMHLIAEEVAARISVPLVHIIDETASALKAAGRRRPLLLATRYTMEHGFYADRMAELGVSVMVPDVDDRTAVHDIIFDELCAGKVRDESRVKLLEIVERAKAGGADSVILGCTEICLILDAEKLPLPGFDSTTIHAQAAVHFALAPLANIDAEAA